MSSERLGETEEGVVLSQRRPCGESAFAEAFLRIADEQGGAGAFLYTESLTGRAPAERAVERKMMRVERLEAAATTVTGKVLAKAFDLPVRLLLAFLNVSA